MIALGMLVPPTELPADFDDGYDTDIGTPGIPSFKLKFTTAHRVSAREIEAALGTHDATPTALRITSGTRTLVRGHEKVRRILPIVATPLVMRLTS